MELHGKNIIAGDLSGEGKAVFQGANPATGERLETQFHEASSGEIDRALKAAEGAFAVCGSLGAVERAGFLRCIADEIEALGEDLIQCAKAETGLPEVRLTGERGRTVNQLCMFADLVEEGSWVEARIDRPMPDRTPIPKPDLRRMLLPMGPVVTWWSWS